jgi:hypothetical protein
LARRNGEVIGAGDVHVEIAVGGSGDEGGGEQQSGKHHFLLIERRIAGPIAGMSSIVAIQRDAC